VSPGEGRRVAELLDDSDGLARETLLDRSAERAPGMVRAWPQLVQSAPELWAVLPPDQTASANRDPIGILAAMGRAVGRGLAAGHWPGQGPRDEAWEQITSNLVQARRLLQQHQVAPEAASTDGPIGPTSANTQSCTPCMSLHTPQRWLWLGISVTCNIAWRLVRGDGNPLLSDLPCWRSSRRRA
jgi:hypothetical protein